MGFALISVLFWWWWGLETIPHACDSPYTHAHTHTHELKKILVYVCVEGSHGPFLKHSFLHCHQQTQPTAAKCAYLQLLPCVLLALEAPVVS